MDRHYDTYDYSTSGRTRPMLNYGSTDRTFSSYPATTRTDVWPAKDSGFAGDNWNKKPASGSGYERKVTFDEYVTKRAGELIKPSGNSYGYPDSYSRPQNPSQFGDYNNYKLDWSKSSATSGYPTRSEGHDYFQSQWHDHNSGPQNYMSGDISGVSSGGWSHSAVPPARNGGSLTRPTNDIGTAMEYLKEASGGSVSPSSQLPGQVLMSQAQQYVGTKMTGAVADPARRYGNYSVFSRRSGT